MLTSASIRRLAVAALVLFSTAAAWMATSVAQAADPAAVEQPQAATTAAELPQATAPATVADPAGTPATTAQPPRTLRAYWHLFIAFAVTWLLLFGYAISVGRRWARLEREVQALKLE